MTFNLGSRFNSGNVSFVPSNISDLELWLEADTGITLDGSNKVSQWLDLSGNGNHASQSNAGVRPTISPTSTQIDGKTSVRFDGIAQWLSGAIDEAVSTDDFTIFIVHRKGVNSNPGAVFNINDPTTSVNGAPGLEWVITGSGNNYNVGMNPIGTSGNACNIYFNNRVANQYILTTLSRDGTALENRTFGRGGNSLKSIATQDYASNPVSSYVLGKQSGIAGFFSGDIYQVLVYSRNLSDTEKAEVQANIRAKLKWDAPLLDVDGQYYYFQANSGLTQPSGLVFNWSEKGGFGNSANSFDSTGPIVQTINGWNAIRFNGTNNRLLNATSWPIDQPITLFMSINPLTWVNEAYILDGMTGHSLCFQQSNGANNVQTVATDPGPYIDTGIGSYGVLAAIFDGTDTRLFWNGVEAVNNTGTGGTTGFSGPCFGASYQNDHHSSFLVTDFIGYQGALTESKIIEMTNLLRSRYGG